MLYDTFELEDLLESLQGPYNRDKVVTLAIIEKVFSRLKAAAILHMNSTELESIKYRQDYASWAEELVSKLNFEIRLYDDEEAMDERLSYYASVVLVIREGLISLRHFYLKEGGVRIDWNN